MFRRILRRLSYANVMATLAVFIALGGGAYAVQVAEKNSVRSSSIKNNQVKSPDIRNDSIKDKDVDKDSHAFGPGVIFGRMTDLNDTGMLGFQQYGPYGVDSPPALAPPFPVELRDFSAAGNSGVQGDDVIQIRLNTDNEPGPCLHNPDPCVPLCTVTGAASSCEAAGPVLIPAGNSFAFDTANENLEFPSETVDFSYRLVPEG